MLGLCFHNGSKFFTMFHIIETKAKVNRSKNGVVRPRMWSMNLEGQEKTVKRWHRDNLLLIEDPG